MLERAIKTYGTIGKDEMLEPSTFSSSELYGIMWGSIDAMKKRGLVEHIYS
jgi:hypothetical protein